MAKILVVDDDPMVRRVIADNLEEAGHSVVEAASGQDAVSRLEVDADFDLILVDFVMPAMNGDEVARRAHDLYPDLKIAFLTGYGQFLEVTGRGGRIPKINKAGRARDLVAIVETMLDS